MLCVLSVSRLGGHCAVIIAPKLSCLVYERLTIALFVVFLFAFLPLSCRAVSCCGFTGGLADAVAGQCGAQAGGGAEAGSKRRGHTQVGCHYSGGGILVAGCASIPCVQGD